MGKIDMNDEFKMMNKTIFCHLPRGDDKTHPSVMVNGSQY
jgi:hypothetical protein